MSGIRDKTQALMLAERAVVPAEQWTLAAGRQQTEGTQHRLVRPTLTAQHTRGMMPRQVGAALHYLYFSSYLGLWAEGAVRDAGAFSGFIELSSW